MPNSSTQAEFQHSTQNFEIPFVAQFSEIVQPFDTTEIKATEVPDWVFPKTQPISAEPETTGKTLDDEVIKIEFDLEPKTPQPSELERKLIYFIFSHSPSFANTLVNSETAQSELQGIWQSILDFQLRIGIRNSNPGSNLIKNHTLFLLFQRYNLADILPTKFSSEIQHFTKEMSLVSAALERELAAQFVDHEVIQPDPQEIIQTLIQESRVTSFQEIIDIIKKGPQVKDFEVLFQKKDNPSLTLTDEEVRIFIRANFPLFVLNGQIKISRIQGNSDFLYNDPEGWNPEPISEVAYRQKLEEFGVDELYERTLLAYVNRLNWTVAPFFNMGQEIPGMAEKIVANLDFMKSEWGDDQKRILYALGLIAHEFTHRLQTPELMAKYEPIARATWGRASIWQGFPSEYSSWYASKLFRGDDVTLEEDLADSVQIYVVNDKYLLDNFPERHAFINEHLPFLVPNSAQAVL